MSYTKITSADTVTVVASDVDGNAFTLDTGYYLETKEVDANGQETGVTVTTFFDDKLNEIGEKIEDTSENTVFVTVREYDASKTNPFEEGKENYTEVGYFQTLDSSGSVLESHVWEHQVLDGAFESAKEIEEKTGGAKTTTEYDSSWTVTKKVADLSKTEPDITDTDAGWDDLPIAITQGVTELYLTLDSDTGETVYLKKVGSDYDVVGYKNTYTWDDGTTGGNSGSGYSFFDNEWNFLADGGQDSYGQWYNETIEVAATASKVAHRVEKGSWKSFDSDGNVEFSDAWQWEYAIADGAFLGGSETRNGETTTYNANWEVVSRSFDVSNLTTLDGALAGIVTDMGFKMIDEAKLEAEIKGAYFSDLTGTDLDTAWAAVTYQIGWQGSETFEDGGSWSNKEIILIAGDGSKLGSVNLHTDTWTDAGAASSAAGSAASNINEGIGFNGSDWEWIGGFNVSSDGWIWSSTRQEKTSGTVLSNGDTSTSDFYTEINKNGRVDETALQAVLTDTSSNDITWDGASSDVKWDWVSYWDYAYQSNGDLWGAFLGGYETNNGLKTTFNSDWSVKGTDIDLSDMKLETLSSAELTEINKIFSTAAKKSVQEWDDFKSDTTSSNSNAFKYTDKDGNEVTLTPLNNETTYYDSSDNVVGKINNWSWSDDQGNWGVGENYETYNSTNASYPWEWAGGKNTNYFDGQVDTWYEYTIDTANGYTQKGGFENAFDTSSWSWDYASDGTFLGGTETRDGETLVYDSNWQITSRAGDVSAISGNVLGTGLAALIGEEGLGYDYIDDATILSQIASSYSGVADETAAANLLYKEGWSDSQTDEWGSWENKEISLFLADGTKIGSMNLDKSSWTDTWSGSNETVSNENVNFNGLDWNWLGNINVSSDGWINSNYRVEKSSGAELSNGDTSNVAFYTQVNKNGRLTDEALASKTIDWSDSSSDITWEWVSEWDYSLTDESYLGGKEINRGEVVTYNSDGSMKAREVDQSSLADVDGTDTFPTEVASYFVGATKKSVNNWDDYQTSSAILSSAYTDLNPENSETTYYKADGTPLGKVMKWSWYQDENNWGVGTDYQAYDSNSTDTYWPWIWVGNSNTDNWNGELNTRTHFNEYYSDGTMKKETGSESGAWGSSSWEFNYSQGGQITSGFEITDGLKVKWDKDGPISDKVYTVDESGNDVEVDVTDTLSISSWDLQTSSYADHDELFNAITTDFSNNGTEFVELFNTTTLELEGIRITSPAFQLEFRGAFQVGVNEYGDVEPIGGMITTGMVLDASGAVLADGTDKMNVEVTYLGSILNAFGIFDTHEVASQGGYMSNYLVPEAGEFVLELEHPDSAVTLTTGDLNFGVFEMDGFDFANLANSVPTISNFTIPSSAISNDGTGLFSIDWVDILSAIEAFNISLNSYYVPALGMVDANGVPVDAMEISPEITQGIFDAFNLTVRTEDWGYGPQSNTVVIIEGSDKSVDDLVVKLVDLASGSAVSPVDITSELDGKIHGSPGFYDISLEDIAVALELTNPTLDLNSFGALSVEVTETGTGGKSGSFSLTANQLSSLDSLRPSSIMLEDQYIAGTEMLLVTDGSGTLTNSMSSGVTFSVSKSTDPTAPVETIIIPERVSGTTPGWDDVTSSPGTFTIDWSAVNNAMPAQAITDQYDTLNVTIGSDTKSIFINKSEAIELFITDPDPQVTNDDVLDIMVADAAKTATELVFQFVDQDAVKSPDSQSWTSNLTGTSGAFQIDIADIEADIATAISDGYEKLEVAYVGSASTGFEHSAEIQLFDFPISGPKIQGDFGYPYVDILITDWKGTADPSVIVSQQLMDGTYYSLGSPSFDYVVLDSLDMVVGSIDFDNLGSFGLEGGYYMNGFQVVVDLNRDGIVDPSEPLFDSFYNPQPISLGVTPSFEPVLFINEGITPADTRESITSRLDLQDMEGNSLGAVLDYGANGNALFEKNDSDLTAKITITDGNPYGQYKIVYDDQNDGFGSGDYEIEVNEGPYHIYGLPEAGTFFLISSPFLDTSLVTGSADVDGHIQLFEETSDSVTTPITIDFATSDSNFTAASGANPLVIELTGLDLSKDHTLKVDTNSDNDFTDAVDHEWNWDATTDSWYFSYGAVSAPAAESSVQTVTGPAIELAIFDPDTPNSVANALSADGDEVLSIILGDISVQQSAISFKSIDKTSPPAHTATPMDLNSLVMTGAQSGEYAINLSDSAFITAIRDAQTNGFENLEVSHTDQSGGTVSAEIAFAEILAFEVTV